MSKIRLEASSVCQLKCPGCPNTTNEISRSIGAGYLSFDNFKHVIESARELEEVELSNFGEIFLNPDLAKMIEYALGKGVVLRADNGCNLNTISDEMQELLCVNSFKSITCSLDGASNRVYKMYRRNGDFDKVISVIQDINRFKEKHKTRYPELTWQFIIMPHNILITKRRKSWQRNCQWNFGQKFLGMSMSFQMK